jgi:hypothetical protein
MPMALWYAVKRQTKLSMNSLLLGSSINGVDLDMLPHLQSEFHAFGLFFDIHFRKNNDCTVWIGSDITGGLKLAILCQLRANLTCPSRPQMNIGIFLPILCHLLNRSHDLTLTSKIQKSSVKRLNFKSLQRICT